MGFIPLFITAGGACLLFILTVRNSFVRKLNRQKELSASLYLLSPELGLSPNEIEQPEVMLEKLKNQNPSKEITKEMAEIIRELKINRYQYNNLIKKAPYNWIAKIGGFQPI
jgi:hypothetical protein